MLTTAILFAMAWQSDQGYLSYDQTNYDNQNQYYSPPQPYYVYYGVQYGNSGSGQGFPINGPQYGNNGSGQGTPINELQYGDSGTGQGTPINELQYGNSGTVQGTLINGLQYGSSGTGQGTPINGQTRTMDQGQINGPTTEVSLIFVIVIVYVNFYL